MIKQGDVVTKTNTGQACDAWDAHSWSVNLEANSFSASVSYYYKENDEVELKTHLNEIKKDMEGMSTGAWFLRKKNKEGTEEDTSNFTILNHNWTPFFDTAETWIFPAPEPESGAASLTMAAAALALTALAF